MKTYNEWNVAIAGLLILLVAAIYLIIVLIFIP
jgi:hypothetical protein